MCLPVLAIAAVGSAVAAGTVQAYGAHQEGVAAKKMYQFQSDTASVQQLLAQRAADQNVTLTQQQAARDSEISQQRTAAIRGAQKAALAANGAADSITASDIALDTFDTGKMDEQAIRYNADLKSWAIKEKLGGELWNLNTMKEQYGFAGKNAMRSSNIKVASGLLNTASQVFGAAGMGAGGGSSTAAGRANTSGMSFKSGGSYSNTARFI